MSRDRHQHPARKFPTASCRKARIASGWSAPTCGFINYENPKIVVGSVVHEGDKILMCRRAINPRKGFWTLPAGFLEQNESTMAGAMREAWEEAWQRSRSRRCSRSIRSRG